MDEWDMEGLRSKGLICNGVLLFMVVYINYILVYGYLMVIYGIKV